MNQNMNSQTGGIPNVQPVNNQPTAEPTNTQIDQSYTVDYQPNVAPSPSVNPSVTPNPSVNPSATSGPVPTEPVQTPVTPQPTVEPVTPNPQTVNPTPQPNSTVNTQTTPNQGTVPPVQEIVVPTPNGEETTVTVSRDIRKIEEKEIAPDGLKFAGIVFAILIIFVLFLPYVYQLLK